jgi:hypothetical protein
VVNAGRSYGATTDVTETGSGTTFSLTATWSGYHTSTPAAPGIDFSKNGSSTSTLSVPTGPDVLTLVGAVALGSQRAFQFASGTLDPNRLLRPDPLPTDASGAGNGVPATWWDSLNGDKYAEDYVRTLDRLTAGVASKVLTSQVFGLALETVDSAAAGIANGATMGLSTKWRAKMYGTAATRNHEGFLYNAGTGVGVVTTIATAFANPCAWGTLAQVGLKGISLLGAAGGSVNAYNNWQAGNKWAAAFDVLGVVGSIAQFLKFCFAAGTPLRTPTGSKAIEDFKVGDQILSRDEHDPHAPVSVQTVEAVFVRVGPLLNLYVQGRLIRTSGEHPFYVRGKGWTPANELSRGDWLETSQGEWVPVEGVEDANEVATVYNLRVSEHHTYFVGDAEWGFDVWAHNATYSKVIQNGTAPAPPKFGSAAWTNPRTGNVINRTQGVLSWQEKVGQVIKTKFIEIISGVNNAKNLVPGIKDALKIRGQLISNWFHVEAQAVAIIRALRGTRGLNSIVIEINNTHICSNCLQLATALTKNVKITIRYPSVAGGPADILYAAKTGTSSNIWNLSVRSVCIRSW